MMQRRPYKRRTDRYRGLCHCGEHVWAVLNATASYDRLIWSAVVPRLYVSFFCAGG